MAILELIKANPKLSIVIISAVVTFFTTLVYKYASNQNRIKELKEVQKQCQLKLKEARSKNNAEKMAEIQKQMMACSGEMMKYTMKPMLFTMLPLLILIIWISKIFSATSLGKSWIWWYIVSGIILNIIFRKVLKVA